MIVPTYKEADNLPQLTERIFAACAASNLDAELIIVDDNSKDGSVEAVATLAETYNVRIVVREKERGLSSAVLRGFQEAEHPVLVVGVCARVCVCGFFVFFCLFFLFVCC